MTTVHLLLAVLALDARLATVGLRLRYGLERNSTGAESVRARGLTLPGVLDAAELMPADRGEPGSLFPLTWSSGAERALTLGRLSANERKVPVTGTTHLRRGCSPIPATRCSPPWASTLGS